MKQYLDLMKDVLMLGTLVPNRTGTDTISIFGRQMRFNMQDGFPLLTTKKIHFKSVVHELLWFIAGDTNTDYLVKNGVRIWNEWATETGDLGPIYGYQWRNWNGKVDQLAEVIQNIKKNPHSRRHIVNAWNVIDLPDESISPQENVKQNKMALAPCHMMFQFYVRGNKLDLQMYQRSVDVFLGLPFNIASYSLLLHMVAQVTGYEPGEFVWTGGDIHIYINHIDQVHEQLNRKPKKLLPTLLLNKNIKNIDDFGFEDINIVNYVADPHIKAEISI